MSEEATKAAEDVKAGIVAGAVKIADGKAMPNDELLKMNW